jgi:hypothetical protein
MKGDQVTKTFTNPILPFRILCYAMVRTTVTYSMSLSGSIIQRRPAAQKGYPHALVCGDSVSTIWVIFVLMLPLAAQSMLSPILVRSDSIRGG